MYVHHTIIRRLFLLYAQSLRSIACFAGLFLRRQRRPSLYTFYYNELIHLTDYRLVVYRRRQIGDITTVDSYYEGSGKARSERSERLLSSIRRLFLPTVLLRRLVGAHSWFILTATIFYGFIHYVREIMDSYFYYLSAHILLTFIPSFACFVTPFLRHFSPLLSTFILLK